MSKNVLVITYDFPPVNTVAARRYGELLPHIREFGWRPWVLTAQSNGPLPVHLPSTSVIRIGKHIQQNSRMDRSRLPFGWEILRASLRPLRIRSRTINRFIGWIRTVHRQRCDIIGQLPKIHAVIASFPREAVFLLGRLFGQYYRAPWIADFRDLGALFQDDRCWIAKRFDEISESFQLRGARAILTVSATMAEILERKYRLPARVVYNGWESSAKSNDIEVRTYKVKRASLYYAGGLLPQYRCRSIQLILDALVRRPELCLVIRSRGPAEQERTIERAARDRGLAERVDIRPPCDPQTVRREAGEALANVVVEDLDTTWLASRGTLTGKFLGLLPLPTPILVVARADSDIGPILRETGKGELCSSVDQILSFLDAAQRDSTSFAGDPESIAQYSKKAQARRLAHLLNDVVRTAPRRASARC